MSGAPVVVALGEVMLRLSPVPDRRLENADTLRVHAAGAEANVAAALARLGVPASLITALPDSPLGHRAAGELAAAGVDLRGVQWHAGARMGTFFVEQGPPVRATSVWYDRAASAFAELIDWPAGALDGARVAVLSGITPALSPAARRAAAAMVAEAVASGVSLCVDVNHRARLWSAEQAREALAPLLAQADIVVCAERDARALFGAEAAQPAALRDGWAPRASVCVVTRGERGCAGVSADGSAIEVEAVPTTLVGRLGLGDAFVAGLLRSLLADDDLTAALRSGGALAALKATVSGDLSLARPDDLDALLDQPTPRAVLR